MTPLYRVEVTRRAAAEIRSAAAWWRSHRSKAPDALADDLRDAFDLLSAQAEVDVRASDALLAGVRRLHLGRVRYYVYYRVVPEPRIVQILALWHVRRAGSPEL